MREHHEHHYEKTVTKNLKIAFLLNLVFTFVELIGGYFTNSMAILADAVHDLGNTLAIGVAVLFEKYAQKKANDQYNYGYKRFSSLSALINSIILFIGSVIIIRQSIPHLWQPEEVNTKGMILLALFGIMFNGLAVFRLMGKTTSINQNTVMLHLFEDLFGWLAVLFGSIGMYLFNFTMLDPILSIGIACYILFNTFRSIQSLISIFLQSKPKNVNLKNIKKEIKALENAHQVKDLKTWTLDGKHHVASVVVVVSKGTPTYQQERLRNEVNAILVKNSFIDITVEFQESKKKANFIGNFYILQ